MSRKVALLKSRFSYLGGLEKMARCYAGAFADKGCEVDVLTTDYHEKQPENFSVINLGPKAKSSLLHQYQFNRWCLKWLKNNNYDIVFGMDRNNCHQTHYRAGGGVHAAFLDARKAEASWIKSLDLRFNPRHLMTLRFEKQTFESVTLRAIFTVSAMVKHEILRYYQVKPEKIHVCYDRFAWKEASDGFNTWTKSRDPIRRSLSLDEHAIQILFIGHDYTRKGLRYLLQGLAQFPDSHFQLSVVGRDKNIAKYVALCKRLGLAAKVKFFGPQENIIKFYQMADVFIILPSYDPIGGVGCEALSMGLFTILSSKAGSSELINATNGRVVSYPNMNNLTSSLSIALQHTKTITHANRIRDCVKHLIAGDQINQLVDLTLNSNIS